MHEQIERTIETFVAEYMEHKAIKTEWKKPLTAYAAVNDPLFHHLKEVVSPTHSLPTDLLSNAKTVIAYFIPFENRISQSNVEGREASRKWAIAYLDTNQLILDLNLHLQNKLKEMDHSSAIIPATHNFDEEKLMADWSHRHVAYIAGLGNFGLNNMLITDKGCSGRLGSIITDLELKPTKRDGRERCLYKLNGSCSKCVSRCVNHALFEDGFDRHKCYEMLLHNDNLYTDLGLVDVCGKCVVGLPCTNIDPCRKINK
ncbi:MAG: epoxyqueuosine reductase [Bacillota bacterium]|nr:epoxyqueuosine reductase [Bacillota bacterium]HHU62077.1 epoxyqueuosine reductase [Natronincola sp.]